MMNVESNPLHLNSRRPHKTPECRLQLSFHEERDRFQRIKAANQRKNKIGTRRKTKPVEPIEIRSAIQRAKARYDSVERFRRPVESPHVANDAAHRVVCLHLELRNHRRRDIHGSDVDASPEEVYRIITCAASKIENPHPGSK